MKKIGGLLLCGVLLAGCGTVQPSPATAETSMPDGPGESVYSATEDMIVVGVSQVGSESVWRTENTESIQSVFTKENGYFLLFDNARQKQENQIKALRSFISQRVDYIVLSPLTEDGWDTVFEEARDAGIPVILIDRKANVKDPSLITAWVGSNFHWEGVQAGRVLEQMLERQGRADDAVRIVTLRGTDGGTATIGRTEGFAEVAEEHPNWIMVDSVDGDFTTTKGKEEMRKLLDRYSDIDVVISQNDDMSFGAIEAIREAGLVPAADGDMMVFSFDATPNGLKLVRSGAITADIECNPNSGEYVDQVIRNLEAGRAVEKEQYVEETVYTAENVPEEKTKS